MLFAVFCLLISSIVYVLSYTPTIFLFYGFDLERFWNQQLYMVRFSAHLPTEKPHPYWSQPWTWPFILRPVLTCYDVVKIGDEEFVHCICDFGNPITWVLGLIVVLNALIDLYYDKNKRDFSTLFLIFWFLITWLPYFPLGISKLFGLGREMFIYYFLQCLPPLVIFFAECVSTANDYIDSRIVALSILIALFSFYVYAYPVISGILVEVDYIRGMKILKLL